MAIKIKSYNSCYQEALKKKKTLKLSIIANINLLK